MNQHGFGDTKGGVGGGVGGGIVVLGVERGRKDVELEDIKGWVVEESEDMVICLVAGKVFRLNAKTLSRTSEAANSQFKSAILPYDLTTYTLNPYVLYDTNASKAHETSMPQ